MTWTWVALRSLTRSSRERQVKSARVGREIAPVEEVPGDGGELHPLSIRGLKRDFLTGEELGAFELGGLLDEALELKAGRRSRRSAGASTAAASGSSSSGPRRGRGSPSRSASPSSAATPIVLRGDELQLSRGESIGDTGRVLSRYLDAIVIRSGSHEHVAELAAGAEVPVVNALTPLHHPCQALADLLTLRERFGDLDGLRLAYVGDGNNVARSLAIACELAGVEFVVAAPDGYQLEEGHGARLTDDPRAAADGADAIYTDVWVSMGDEEEAERRRARPRSLPGRRRPARRRQGRGDRPPLPARPPGRGDHRRRPLRRALRRLGPGREPAPRPEGAAARADGRGVGAAVYPEIHLGPLTLQTFGLMFALAFLAAGALIARRLGEIGKPVDWAYEMGFAALVGGIVGSRVYFIVQNYDSVKDDLLGNLFSGAGLVWYGGAIGGALAVLLWAWWRGFLGLALLDLCAPALALGYAIGRGRLPALRRRRLRQGLGRALGDVLPRRHRAHRRNRPPDPGLRDAGDGAGRLAALAAARPLPRRGPLRDLPGLRRQPSASWSSSCAATTPSPSASPPPSSRAWR